MTALRAKAGRSKRTLAVVGAAVTVTIASLLVMTDFPRAFASDGGGSAALTELAARSPGMRVGGIALKAKTRRAAPVGRVARAPAGPAETPVAPMASVLSSGPLGPAAVPGLGTFPSDFVQPATGPVPGVPGTFPVMPGPGPVLIGGGGGGGGAPTPGGGGSVVPTPTPTPTPTSTPTPGPSPSPTPTDTPTPEPTPTFTPPVLPTPTPTPTVPPVTAVPEPGTWLMLILGFGLVGGALRRRRVRLASAAP